MDEQEEEEDPDKYEEDRDTYEEDPDNDEYSHDPDKPSNSYGKGYSRYDPIGASTQQLSLVLLVASLMLSL